MCSRGNPTILVEIQALVDRHAIRHGPSCSDRCGLQPYIRAGGDAGKALGVQMTGSDIYVNAAGGLEIDEPGSDLVIFAAILSSMRNRPWPPTPCYWES